MSGQGQEKTEQKPVRKLPLTQCDEIWDVAKDRWGDPGRRFPKPDKRFETLRDLLSKIDNLFGQTNTNSERDGLEFPTALDLDEEDDGTRKFSVKKKHIGGRKIAHDHLDDEDDDSEPGF